jgi:hypothetical protein
MSDATTPSHCPNCDHRLAPWDRYCSHCGQSAQNHAPTLWEFVHEWIVHYVALEGALWKSLWALMARPGFLTLEYLGGRRRRYVLPLRLVLTLGLVYFLLLKLVVAPGTGLELEANLEAPTAASAPPLAASEASAASSPAPAASSEAAELEAPPWLEPRVLRARDAYRRDPTAFAERAVTGALSVAPYAVLASIPVYAALLAGVHWGRRRTYGEHFVFAMHLHAFWYGCLLLALLPLPWLGGLLWAWSNVYPLIALQRVYGGRWPAVLLRAAALALLHLLLLGLGLGTVLAFGALSG